MQNCVFNIVPREEMIWREPENLANRLDNIKAGIYKVDAEDLQDLLEHPLFPALNAASRMDDEDTTHVYAFRAMSALYRKLGDRYILFENSF